MEHQQNHGCNNLFSGQTPPPSPAGRIFRPLRSEEQYPSLFTETSVQDPYQDEYLDSIFSRLAVSANGSINSPRYLSASNGGFSVGSISGSSIDSLSGFGVGLWRQRQNNPQNIDARRSLLSPEPFYRMLYSSYIDRLCSVSHQTPNFVNANGFSRPLLRDSSQQEARYGSMNGLVSHNQNLGLYNRRANESQETSIYLPLEYLRGRMVSLAKDKTGCQLLINTMGNITMEEVDIVILELIEHMGDLMVNQHGCNVVQKLVEVCNAEQLTEILTALAQKEFQLVGICLNVYGTRAVQKMLAHLSTGYQVSIFMAAIGPATIALCKDVNGHHVIANCVKLFSDEDNKFVLFEVANNCFQLAMDRSGCIVLQKCVEHSGGDLKDCLVEQITVNAITLAGDCYGNYVVQHLLGLGIPQITRNLLLKFKGNYVILSCNKYGSNVVEKCLEVGGEQTTEIILELLENPNCSMLLVDPYANYVIKSAFALSKGRVRTALVDLIRANALNLRNNIYGRKVLECLEGNRRQLRNR